MCKLCRYGIILLCLLSTVYAYAADSVQYQHFTIDNGLPTNNVYACMEDHDGYLWFATDKGAVKYNGYSFHTFNTANGGLPDDDVYQLIEDNTGRIWTYTLTRRFGFIKDDKYTDLQFPGVQTNSLANTAPVYPTGPYITFVAPMNAEMYYFVADSVIRLALPLGKEIRRYWETGTKLFAINLVEHNQRYIEYDMLHPLSAGIYRKAFFNLTNEFIGTFNFFQHKNFIYGYYTGSNKVQRFDFEHRRVITTFLDQYNSKEKETIYTANNFYFPYAIITGSNIYYLNEQLQLLYKESFKERFPNTQISYVKKDNNNNRWLLSNTEGVWQEWKYPSSLISKTEKMQAVFNTRLVGSNGLSAYWWNTKEQCLYQADQEFNITKRKFPVAGNIRFVSPVGDTQLMISDAKKIFSLDTRTGRPDYFFSNIREGVYTDIDWGNRVLHSGSDRVWSGTGFRDALANPNAFKPINNQKVICANVLGLFRCSLYRDTMFIKNIIHQRYNYIVDSVLNHVLFYNTESVATYNVVTDSLSTYYFKNVPAIGKINVLAVDKWNNIYLLNNSLLFMLDLSHFKWRYLAANFNLTNSKLSVNGNKLLLAGNFGVAIAKIEGQGKVSGFRFMPNLKNFFYRQVNYLWMGNNGNVLLQTDKRVLCSNADSLLRYGKDYAESSICKFSIVLKQPYDKIVHAGDTLLLDQKKTSMLLDAINFYGSGSATYQYLLTAEKAQWQSSSSGDISFSSTIEPGIYYPLQLQVSDDMWKSDIMQLYIYITPYWYQTHNAHVFFLVAGSLILILAVIGIISLVRQATIRAQAKKRMLTELELRAVYSQINPHFIFNTLSTALYFIDKKDYDNAYKHVNKFSHLLRSYLKSSHDRYILLSEEIDMLKRYIELQQTRFENLFTYEIKVNNKVPADHIQMPSLLLQPLVENAINHGLFHRKEPGGLLYISFEQGRSAEELVCIIEDNGIGRMRAMDLKKANDAERTSYGSKLTDKLVDIFRQYEAMNIHIEYIDKTEPGTGTIVRLTIGNVKYVV